MTSRYPDWQTSTPKISYWLMNINNPVLPMSTKFTQPSPYTSWPQLAIRSVHGQQSVVTSQVFHFSEIYFTNHEFLIRCYEKSRSQNGASLFVDNLLEQFPQVMLTCPRTNRISLFQGRDHMPEPWDSQL